MRNMYSGKIDPYPMTIDEDDGYASSKNLKVFISMPMKSKSTAQVRIEMDKTFQKIQSKLPGVELIDSIIPDADVNIALNGDDMGVWYLGESLKRMSKADIVFFVGDWEKYRGCTVEHSVAIAYGKYCIEIERAGDE